jgi:hypothetical protein
VIAAFPSVRERTILPPEVRLSRALNDLCRLTGISTAQRPELDEWLNAKQGFRLAADAVMYASHTAPLHWLLLEYKRLPSSQRQPPIPK